MFASKEWTLDLTRKVVREAKKDRPVYFDEYSENEVIIGSWIDGKPIYRKIIRTKLSASANTDIDVSNLNRETVIKAYGFVHNATNGTYDGYCEYFPNSVNGTNRLLWYDNNFSTAAQRNTIRLSNTATGYYNKMIDLVLEYTKTTDAPNSFEPSMIKTNKIDYQVDNLNVGFQDYNESEIIIGKWIDGRPIYRKVVRPPKELIMDANTWYKTGYMMPDMVPLKVILYYQYTDGGSNTPPIGFYCHTDGELQIMTYRAGSVKQYVFTDRHYYIIEYTKTTDAPDSFSMDALLQQYNFNSNIENVVLDEYCSPDDIEEVLG